MTDKREQLITAALSLFYRHGIHAIGINEVLKQAGVAKKTLYSHFSGKEALVVAAVAYRDELFYHWLAERMGSPKNSTAAVKSLFSALDDWFNDRVEVLERFRGCFFVNASAEYSDPTHPVQQQCRLHKLRINALLDEILTPLITSKKQREALVETLALLKEGAISLAHVQGDQNAAKKAEKRALALLK